MNKSDLNRTSGVREAEGKHSTWEEKYYLYLLRETKIDFCRGEKASHPMIGLSSLEEVTKH